jgi:hypothetical protein
MYQIIDPGKQKCRKNKLIKPGLFRKKKTIFINKMKAKREYKKLDKEADKQQAETVSCAVKIKIFLQCLGGYNGCCIDSYT